MISLLGLAIVLYDPEPLDVPRRTESADKSDALQTLRAVRRRPAVAKRLECVRLQRRFPTAVLRSDGRVGSWIGFFRFSACIGTMNL
jgi:hypothetical protein